MAAEAQNNAFRNEVFEQRQRSSSTSDAQGLRNRSNNNNSSNNNNISSGNQNNGNSLVYPSQNGQFNYIRFFTTNY